MAEPLTHNERLDGPGLLSMFESALELLEVNVPEINRLNVFPVPDGDTGINMYLTLLDVVSNTAPDVSPSVGETSRLMAEHALNGGRGNSGVLLSQFFMGMAEALEGHTDFGTEDLARSLSAASVHAYGGIGHPREGTILTVMRESSDAAHASSSDDLAGLLDVVCDAALESVARTPTLLSVLRKAGLVDSGGYGFYVMLEGARRHLRQTGDLDEMLTPPQPISLDGNISSEFLDEIEEEEFGYCTQFMISGPSLDKDSIMTMLEELGNSPVVIGTDSLVRIHVHTTEPDDVVDYGRTLGEVFKENIQNMDEQREQFSAERRAELGVEDVAVVAVVQGEGLEEVFRGFSVENFVSGGDSMNPSVGDVLRAIEDAPLENVVFLPNNPNIILAAEQAAERSSKNVRVVPSRTVVQGIMTVLNYDLTKGSLADHAEEMVNQLQTARTGEICFASRDAELDGVRVQEDQLIAMLDRRLVYADDSLEGVITGLLRIAETDEPVDLATLYWGDQMDEEQTDKLASQLQDNFPEIEFEVVYGGQPHYHLFMSLE
ncbi:MAG: DAK2 domain-containing protein [Dehalococcoidia bacterium]|nr:DAK2 domain-containing protein [Dehalococcoidia bacterium]